MNKYSSASLVLFSLLLSACVNNIMEEDAQPGNIPMTFTVKDISSTSTKVSGNSFDKEDEIGLFATFSDVDIDQDRYIDNLRLISNGDSELIPEREIFYPESNAELDIVAYYPYDKDGIEVGSSTLPISVQSNQSSAANLSASDFLMAQVKEVSGSEAPIELEFEHKLTKIEIALSVAEDEDIDDLLEDDPYIIASGFKTRAQYDVLSGSFENLEHAVDIVPYGKWEKKGGKLVGKEFIIIPQDDDDGEQAFVMEWNGRLYTCPMPDIEMESNMICEIDIRTFQTTSSTLSSATASIKDWEYSTEAESDTEYDLSTIRIASLSFKDSHVYRVYYENKPVAEVCKEYLLSDDASISSEAVVVYPVQNEEADWSQGTVLRLEGEEQPVHGGRIQWDETDNTFEYAKGESEPITQFYIDGSGAISLSKPSRPAHINVKAYNLRDMRGGELQEYPIVKIGTQYWMREDLRTTRYQEAIGGELRKLTRLSGKSGYIVQGDTYFYPGETLLEGELAPYGWKIPDADDWDKLIAYVHRDASILKGGVWKGITSADEVFPATNLTGLNLLPNGFYTENDEGETKRMNYEITVGYWADKKDNQTSLPTGAVYLMHSNNTINFGNNKVASGEYYRALNIRCVKKND